MGGVDHAINVLDVLAPALEMVPLLGGSLKAAAELASAICESIKTVKENREAYVRLGNRVAALLAAIANVLQKAEPKKLPGMQGNVANLTRVLEQVHSAVSKRARSAPTPARRRDRLTSWLRQTGEGAKRQSTDKDEVEALQVELDLVVEEFQVTALMRNELSLDAVRKLSTQLLDRLMHLETIHSRMAKDADNATLATLMPVTSAPWDMVDLPMCMANTRAELLSDIWCWVESRSDPVVFWLNGLAGTGKSTVARTLCQRLADAGLLGASFFITRQRAERRDPSNILRSVVYQLARQDSAVADSVCSTLRDHPDLASARPLHEQVSELLVTPAKSLQRDGCLVLVIDALDECALDARGRHGGDLLPLLARAILQLSGRVKLLITSRLESSIRAAFVDLTAQAQHKVVQLHDLDRSMVENDVRTYLTGSFQEIASAGARRGLRLGNWPPVGAIETLVKRAEVLFVYASTVVRFVDNHQYSPRSRLEHLLAAEKGTSASPYRILDQLYIQVLTDAVHTDGLDEVVLCQRLKNILGAVILAYHPLGMDPLATLANVDVDEASLVIQRLSALLLFGVDEPVRTFHPSFPDFVTDASRCTNVKGEVDSRFFISTPEHHRDLAGRCLDVMNRSLQFNLCSLREPSRPNASQPELIHRLREQVSDMLKYACRFWAMHLSAAAAPNGWLLDLLNTFCRGHLFHWLEVLSLVGELSSVERGLPRAIEWCQIHAQGPREMLCEQLLSNTLRTSRTYEHTIESCALHVYLSAYVTMPQCEILDTLPLDGPLANLPSLKSPRLSHWGPSVRVLEGHRAPVTWAALSADGARVASASDDCTIGVWDVVTGQQEAILEGHSDSVTCVCFSPNGLYIVTGSRDKSIRIYDTATFKEIAELEGHTGPVSSLIVSTDSTRIMSSSHDGTLRVWHAITLEGIAQLLGHLDWVRCLALSYDGRHMASGSDDRTVRLWDLDALSPVATLEGHEDFVTSVAFSPNEARLVSGSDDRTLRIWDTVSFTLLAELRGHKFSVVCVAYSPDGNRIASGSSDWSIRLWDANTYTSAGRIDGHDDYVRSVVFTPEGTRLVSASSDFTVRIWDVSGSVSSPALPGHSSRVWAIAFSPDGTRIASGSSDHTVRIWSTAEFKELSTCEGHQDWVRAVAFSPDGGYLVSGSDDFTVRLWDMSSYRQLVKLEGHGDYISDVFFSQDGRSVFSHAHNDEELAWTCVDDLWVPGEFHSSDKADKWPRFTITNSGWVECVLSPNDAKIRLLKLPVERRGHILDSSGYKLAVGAYSGVVSLFDFTLAATRSLAISV